MTENHFQFWPKRVTKTLAVPSTNVFDNLYVSAKRYPNKPAIYYYGASYTYKQLLTEVERMAGFLQHRLHVEKGDRVMLYMQNSPQFIIGYYAILRANAIVIPINPMNTTEELNYFIKDGDIQTGLVSQELLERIESLPDDCPLEQIVIATYSDYLPEKTDERLPIEVKEKRKLFSNPNYYSWQLAMEANESPSSEIGNAEDFAVMPYTSGTTGLPKGCLHKHTSIQANIYSAYHWLNVTVSTVSLTTLPLFHVTGMLHSMHAPILAGGELVIMTRWDKYYAKEIIKRKKVSHWVNISTMLIDFLTIPSLSKRDMESLLVIAGGGASLPSAVGKKLFDLTGLQFVEGYGLSETMSHTHFNPPHRPKLQCLGIPSFDVDARIIDPINLQELGDEEEGEIVVNGPQVFVGYYNREEDNKQAFIEIDGKRFFRTGDIGIRDKEGYYFIIDRVKRMINASGYNVWPTEIESQLYKHPAVQQACVVGVPDQKRGETVKVFIVLNDEYRGSVTEEEIIAWSKKQMAAYKYPRYVEFRESLPTTSSGKILWRKLEEEEQEKNKLKK